MMAAGRCCCLPDMRFAAAATRLPAAGEGIRNSSGSAHNIHRRECMRAEVGDTGCCYCNGTWPIRFPCKAVDPVGADDGLRKS